MRDGVWGGVQLGTFYTDQHNIIDHVYKPGLAYAGRYTRDTGSFSSNVYFQMGFELLEFLLREDDNHMTLICSEYMKTEDVQALFDSENNVSEQDAREYLKSILNEYLKTDSSVSSPVKMLISLIAAKKLSLVINFRSQAGTKTDHSHSKSGIFEIPSTGEILYFSGSVNETYPALEPELEKGNADQYMVYHKSPNQSEYDLYIDPAYDRLTKSANANKPTLVAKGTISVPMRFLDRDDFPTLSDDDWDLEKHKEKAKERSKNAFEKFSARVKGEKPESQEEASVPSPPRMTAWEWTGDRPHQREAIRAWEEDGRRGILKHATGSGKTITSISAIERHLAESESNFAVLVVPYKTLQNQWNGELRKFGINSVSIGGDSDHRLQNEVISQLRSGIFNSNCVLNFVQNTFTQKDTVTAIGSMVESAGRRALFVFDECHHLGRPSYSQYTRLGVYFPHVLGLSATPFSKEAEDSQIRDGWWEDRELSRFELDAMSRNKQIKDILGDVVHSFGLREALRLEYLTPYNYTIYHGEMTEQEQRDYDHYRKLIPKQMNLDNPSAVHLSRSIVKSMSAKIKIAEEIITQKYKPGEHWLIYCSHDSFLQSIKETLKQHDLNWWEYTSHNSDSRELHMKRFEDEGGLMLAVKCLDEGVDIPKITHGIILSSNTIEREFIQRRGRMLRWAPGKNKAVIYDVITIPNINAGSKSIESIEKHELARLEHFAEDASNKDELQIKIKMLGEIFETIRRRSKA